MSSGKLRLIRVATTTGKSAALGSGTRREPAGRVSDSRAVRSIQLTMRSGNN
jgi:hypothetical protein